MMVVIATCVAIPIGLAILLCIVRACRLRRAAAAGMGGGGDLPMTIVHAHGGPPQFVYGPQGGFAPGQPQQFYAGAFPPSAPGMPGGAYPPSAPGGGYPTIGGGGGGYPAIGGGGEYPAVAYPDGKPPAGY